MVASLLSRYPSAGSYCLIAVGRTVTVVVVERGPVIVQTISKHKINSAVDGSGVCVNTILESHLNAATGIPVTEGDIAHDVHRRIGIVANEGKHH